MTRALVIGGGPAGLMAADRLAASGVSVVLCDGKPSVGRKFLMAGKSGLNLTKSEPIEDFIPKYAEAVDRLAPLIQAFDAKAVQHWAGTLGQEVFTGSSGRVFPKTMKASPLLRSWLARLDGLAVERRTRWRWTGWDGAAALFDTPDGAQSITADVTVLALGGGSWARLGSDGAWQKILNREGVALSPFAPSNTGLNVAWTSHMAPFFGTSLKAVAWWAGDLVTRGEAVLSKTGLEGGGIYTLTPALRNNTPLYVDLAPDVSFEKLQLELAQKPQKLRLGQWLKNTRRLAPVKVALFYEMTAGAPLDRADWVTRIKALPLRYDGLCPMDEAISTAGGVRWEALTPDLMLTARPGVFCAGEMLDWEAPTGGYLITAALATGLAAGEGALAYLAAAA